MCVQDEGRLTEQLFNLYHSEKRITTTAELIKDKQKELDKQVHTHTHSKIWLYFKNF